MISSIVYFGLLLALVLMMVNIAGTFAQTDRNRGYDVSNLAGDLGNVHLDSPTNDDRPISRSSPSIPRSFARSLSRSLSQTLKKGKSKAEFNVDDLQYDGEPITFACIAKADHREFYGAGVTDRIPDYLIEMLNNRRGLSLFFLGAGNEITSASGLLFKFAREWFITSGNNVCFVSYCYSDKPRTGCQAIGHLDKLVATNRLEYVAKMARDLVLNVRNQSQSSAGDNILHMSRVDVTGFSFGAHIAGRTAEYLLSKTGEKVRMLLALDPSRTPPVVAKTPKDTIKPDLAEYVQVIHSSNVQGMTKTRLGHVDIYARLNGGRILNNNHALAFFLHVATATKRFYIVADEGSKGKGKLVQIQGDILPQPKSNECQLGIYAVLNENHIGQKFGFSLTKREEFFFSALGQYADPSVFSD
ncbi:uncharacterized protein LOC116344472 [Contarinia nasturtii]|uniref:uncharacterized protein LOC116344472 n=1 Tax=Contarinia nasturtii TaxID=265458 RepID=UPI0012D3759A|nr:uncharacterized protein LOC116344472 [Contarinia nasturtii]